MSTEKILEHRACTVSLQLSLSWVDHFASSNYPNGLQLPILEGCRSSHIIATGHNKLMTLLNPPSLNSVRSSQSILLSNVAAVLLMFWNSHTAKTLKKWSKEKFKSTRRIVTRTKVSSKAIISERDSWQVLWKSSGIYNFFTKLSMLCMPWFI